MESAVTEGIAGGQVFHGEHDEGDHGHTTARRRQNDEGDGAQKDDETH